MRFWRNAAIESKASERLTELGVRLGRPVEAPISIDLLVEGILGLDFLWEEIDEEPGEVVLAYLCPDRRLVVMNERHQALFQRRPGLERFTVMHEAGHWDLFLRNVTTDHPRLFGDNDSSVSRERYRHLTRVTIPRALMKDPDGIELLTRITSREDDKDERRVVNRYAAAILMPSNLLRCDVQAREIRGWADIYALADRYQVTATAMKIRLEQLSISSIDEDGVVHASRAEREGQQRLFTQ